MAALDIALNVLDIVGSARLATGEHFLEIPNLQAGVRGGRLPVHRQHRPDLGRPARVRQAELARERRPQRPARGQPRHRPSPTCRASASQGIGDAPDRRRARAACSVNLADGEGRLVAPPEVHCGTGTAIGPASASPSRSSTQPASYSLSDGPGGLAASIKVSHPPGPRPRWTARRTPRDPAPEQGGRTGQRASRTWAATSPRRHLRRRACSCRRTTSPPRRDGDVAPYLDPRYVVPTVTGVKDRRQGGVDRRWSPSLTNPIVNELVSLEKGIRSEDDRAARSTTSTTSLIGPVARMVGLRFGGADVYAVGAVCGRPFTGRMTLSGRS